MAKLRVLFIGGSGVISSASAYQTPPARMPVTESTPLRNPFWRYSRDKIACEELLTEAYREQGFPATIVRPSHTYDPTLVPFHGGWTVLGRMLAGKPVIVPGWHAMIPFEHGARQIVEWYLADPARQVTDTSLDAVMDKLATAWAV
jgi:dTDP-D-glucose 4,6-dehydratase